MTNSSTPSQIDLTGSVEKNIDGAQESHDRLQEIALVLRALAKEVATALEAKACCIYVLDRPRQELNPVTHWSASGTITNFTRQPVNNSIVGLAIQTWSNHPSNTDAYPGLVRIEDLNNHNHSDGLTLDFPHHSILALPFTSLGSREAAGVLLVADKITASAFLPQDEQLLTTFANRSDLILAVQNLELAQEKQRWDQELIIINQINQTLAAAPQPLDLESACRLVLGMPYLKELFQFDIAEICLWDDQTQTLTAVDRLPKDNPDVEAYSRTYTLNKGYTGWITTHQTPLLVSDIQNRADVTPQDGLQSFSYGSYIGAPLKAGSKFLGTLELAATPTNFYDYRDLAILEVAANQVAIAIDHARRFSFTDQQLQNRIHELAGLQRVSHELNSTLDLDRILSLVLEEAMRVTQADFGNVSLYNARTQELTAHQEQYSAGKGPFLLEQFETMPAQLGIMGRVLKTGTALLIPDVLNYKGFVDQGRNTRSQVVVPIIHGGEPAGVINLENQQFNHFTNDQIRYLEALANHAAIAIGNAQAYQEQKTERERASRRADQLARLAEISNAFRTNRPLYEVLEDIAYAILESVGYSVVVISLVQGDPPIIYPEVGAGILVPQFEALKIVSKQPLSSLQQIMQAEFRLNNTFFIPAEQKEVWLGKLDIPFIEISLKDRLALATVDRRQPDTLENAWQAGDLLFVPLTDTEQNIIGLLTVDNPDTNQRPDLSTIQTLEIFANHAAAAIENARLFELEQQRRRLADTLRGVAETISSQLEIDELLNVVLQELKKVVNYDSANVQRLEDNQLVIIGGQGWVDSQKVVGLTFSITGNNPNRKVIESQEPVIVKDVRNEFPATFSGTVHKPIRSWLGVPLTYGTNVLGLMAVDSHQVDFFTKEDAEVVLAFGNQVAVALQNSRLFDEARQQVRQLAALTEVAQSINRALDLDEVLNQVLDAVFDLVGVNKGSIWLIDAQSHSLKVANTKNIPKIMLEALNESQIPVEIEPFATVIKSGQVSVIQGGGIDQRDRLAGYEVPFPDDVTYVPLKTEKGVFGILAIEAVIHQKSMLALVTTLADLAAIAIDNARLVHRLNLLTEQLELRVRERTKQLAETLQDLTEERDRFEMLYQITREVSVSLDLDRVLTEALNLINRAIGISHGSILLLDHGSGELMYRAALGLDKPLPRGGQKTKYRLGYGLAGTVMELREPRIVPDLSKEPDWISDTEPADRRSAIAVPLATGEGLMGALMLFHPDPDYFTEDHLKLVSAAGAQIANAINNAELYRLITDQAERLGITARIQATEAAKNEAILKDIADGVLVLDARHNIILLNPKAAEILDVDSNLVKNRPIDQILGQSESPVELELTQLFYDNLLKTLTRLEKGEAAAEFRVEVGHKAIVVTLTSVALGAQETLGVVAVIRDISREAEIERLKNEFISTVSHELRTPLTSIKGYADLLASGNAQVGELNAIQQRFVKVIQSNANRLTELVNDILEISRIETGRIKLQLESVDVIQLIREVAISFEGQMVQKVMALSLHLPDQLPAVRTDKARLIQILVNLIGNAWQYTPEGGEIRISAHLVKDKFVQIDVEDTGIGIPEEDIDHIFDRFFRSERHEVQLVDGTGLGLAITRSFIEMLGGEIWVRSEVDVGTTFSFTMPLAAQFETEALVEQDTTGNSDQEFSGD